MPEADLSYVPPDSRWSEAKLGKAEYERLAKYVESATGIRMPLTRLTMLEGRLRERLRLLGLRDYESYCELALGNGGNPAELAYLVDRATTNTTEFFREKAHFEYLAATVLPAQRIALGGSRALRLWSAGCSTGEEPYTLAMVLAEAQAAGRGLSHHILATDISRAVLQVAKRAIYSSDRIAGIPKELRPRYLLSSRNPEKRAVRIVPELRQKVTFRLLNLMDEDYRMHEQADIVFCRNVFIYFDRETQQKVLLHFARQLVSGGYLFLGHTDTIYGMDVPFKQIAPATYRKVD